MRAAFVSHTALLGGAERCLIDLVAGCGPRGVEVTVVCPEEGPLTAALTAIGTPWTVVPMRRPRRSPALMLEMAAQWRPTVARLARVLRDASPDVVLNNTVDGLYAPFAATEARVPCVWHVHESRPDAVWARALIARLMRRHAACTVFNSMATRRAFSGGRAAAADWRVVYNGVAWSDAPPPPRAADGAVVAGFVGDMRPHKRPEMFVHALALARATAPALRGIMVGDGVLLDPVRRLASSLGLEGWIEFRGRVAGLGTLLADIDLLVSTSAREGFGLAIAEAMQAGRAVVAPNVGGVPELVEDGVSGMLVSSADAAAYAAALSALALDSRSRARLAAAGRERVRTHFTLDRYCDNMVTILREAATIPA